MNNMKNSNVSLSIVNKILTKGNREKKEIIPDNLSQIYYYFLKSNLIDILGTNELSQEDGDIISLRDGFIINSVFSSPINIRIINTQVGYTIKGFIGEEEIFSISRIKDLILNEISINGERKAYSVNTNNRRFAYTISNEDETLFQGRMTSLNARIGECEVFEYIRDVPAEEKSPSLFMRIIETFNSDSYVNIRFASDLSDALDAPEEVFGHLIKKSETMLKKEDEKKLKKDNK